MNNPIIAYQEAIENGTVTVGYWVRMFYAYLCRGLLDGTFPYNAKKANKTIKFIETFCHHCKGRSDLIEPKKNGYYMESTNSWILKIAFNSRKSDGFSPHVRVCDEIASWPGEKGLKQYEVMTSATYCFFVKSYKNVRTTLKARNRQDSGLFSLSNPPPFGGGFLMLCGFYLPNSR